MGKRPIGSKLVFKRKLNSDGSLERYQARLVAKGFAQIAGLDFFETTAPVAKMSSVRIYLPLAANEDLQVHHVDVTMAFLIPELEEEVYFLPPIGYRDSLAPEEAWKLLKSIYGLKQHQGPGTRRLKRSFCNQDSFNF